MTEEAQDRSKPTPESYFWLGIYSLSNKWQFVNGTGIKLRNWDSSISDGGHGAVVLGKHQESVIFSFYRIGIDLSPTNVEKHSEKSQIIWLDRSKSTKLSVLCIKILPYDLYT